MSLPSTTHTTPTAAQSSAMDGFGSMVKSQYEMVASWEDPNYSAKVVGGFNAIVLCVWLLDINALTTVLYSAAIIMLSGWPLTRFMHWKHSDAEKTQLFSDEYVKQIVESARIHINTTIFYWTSPKTSALTILALFLTGWFFTVFSVAFLFFFGVNCAILRNPAVKLYKKYGEKAIQPYVHTAQNQLQSVWAKMPALEEIMGKNKKL